MRLRLLTCFTFLFCFTLLNSQTASIQERLKKFEGEVDQILKDWKVPGVGIAIVKGDKTIYAKGFGYKDMETKTPVTENTLFAIGSSSKAFTAAAVCLLAGKEQLDLDEPIKTYLPDFELQDEYSTKKMTPRDLLCHRSGLPRHDFVWYGSSKSRKELFSVLRHLEPTASFRGQWQYQNLMFMSAGYLVEKVSGQSWEEYTKKQIFEPLEMHTANFSVEDSQKSKDFALPYNEEEEQLKKMDFRNIDAIGPAGSINASVKEMANWIALQLNGGTFKGKKIIPARFIAEMQKPQMVMPGNTTDETLYSSYGLGWMITPYRGHLVVHHGGNIDGFSAMVALLPKDSMGFVILTNKNATPAAGILRNELADQLLGLEDIAWSKKNLEQVEKAKAASEKAKTEKDLNQVKGTSPSHSLVDYTGKYEHPAYGIMEIVLEEGKLKTKYHTLELAIDHYHYDLFEVGLGPLGKMKMTFHTGTDGAISMLDIPLQPGVESIEFTRIEEEKIMATGELAPYLGEFELSGMVAKVEEKEGFLRLNVPGQPEYKLLPTKDHQFKIASLEGYSVIFKFETGKEKASALVSVQPNGSFTFPRKK